MLLNTMRGHRLAKVGVFFLCPLGLQIVNLFCILVMCKNTTATYNYSNEYVFGFANGQPLLYI